MSFKRYPYQQGYNGSLILNMDLREDPPIVKEVNKPIPREKSVVVKKQAQFRHNVMNGQPHPILFDVEDYVLVTVHKCAISQHIFHQVSQDAVIHGFNKEELEFIETVQSIPEVEWAIDNSFDGLYIAKESDPSTLSLSFKFAVYLKADQATFWRLKFNGR